MINWDKTRSVILHLRFPQPTHFALQEDTDAMLREINGGSTHAQRLSHLRNRALLDDMQMEDSLSLRSRAALDAIQRQGHQVSFPFGIPNGVQTCRGIGRIVRFAGWTAVFPNVTRSFTSTIV